MGKGGAPNLAGVTEITQLHSRVAGEKVMVALGIGVQRRVAVGGQGQQVGRARLNGRRGCRLGRIGGLRRGLGNDQVGIGAAKTKGA